MTKKLSWVLAFLLVLLLSSAALAEKKHGWPTATLSGGGYSLGSSAGIDAELLYGIKLGYEINGRGFADRLGVEGVFQQSGGELQSDQSDADITLARLDLLYLFDAPKSVKKLVPFFTFGAGGLFVDGEQLSESHPLLAYGVGSRWMLTESLGLRADLRQLLVFADDARTDYEYTLGLSYRFGVERKVEAVPNRTDSDQDGVFDSRDKCPATPSGLKVDKQGCPVDAPDGDRDGVADYLDKCPATPEGYAVDPQGCFFDDDGDGVPNERDRCPSNPPGFQVDENGCTQLLRRSKG